MRISDWSSDVCSSDLPERDYYPRDLRTGIDEVNERVYRTVNNGVYRAGFAQTQEAYEEAVVALFETLDWLEKRLAARRYLMGERQTEADWRLFTTLLRFDPVYHGHFKSNIRRLADYPSLCNFLRDLYKEPGVAATVHLDHIKIGRASCRESGVSTCISRWSTYH